MYNGEQYPQTYRIFSTKLDWSSCYSVGYRGPLRPSGTRLGVVPLLSANSRRWTIPEDATAGMVRPSAVLPEPVDGGNKSAKDWFP
ncbi:hypothetical protein N7497_000981 [Penicillium chrysogenum]|nr:hypothetical protein N7497_000981 [Penicillium chrysogenum]